MSIFKEIEQQTGVRILRHEPVSGGDINHAFRLETERGVHFLKFNTDAHAQPLLDAERRGLERLRRSDCLPVPGIVAHGSTNLGSYLLLDWIEGGSKTGTALRHFGTGLARLHQQTQDYFGGMADNFIGKLPQSNRTWTDDWAEFYTYDRLLPHLKAARNRQLLTAEHRRWFDRFVHRLEELCPAESAALTHGDLWSGNWLVDTEERAWLIDPAVSFQHREMDLGMLTLFGQPGEAFWDAYQSEHPTAPGLEERLPVYQLYYLLVHVGMFGARYVPGTVAILRRFGR